MKKKHFLLLILILMVCHSWAQSFKGLVVDMETKHPVQFVNVFFVELETGTTTNSEGEFQIPHYPKKNIHIQFSYMGYKPLSVVVDLSVSETLLFELEPSHVDLEEVMLSIPGGKLKGEQTVSIIRGSLKQLQQSGEVSLAQALKNISGVDQLSTGPGIGKPIIRGLSGNRIVTYSQGIRVENQQWGAEHGLGLGSIGIEGVEVIKGPASLLYGSDAIGGVLYFVDERYAKHDEVAGYFSEQFFGNTSGASTQMGVKVHKGSSKVNAFGSIANHGDYKIPNGKRVSNSQFNEKNLKFAYGLNKGLWISNIRYSFLENYFGITDSAEYHDERQALDDLPSQLIRTNALSIENTVFTGASKVNLVLGLNANDRKEFEDALGEAALDMKLNTFTYNLKWFSSKQNKSFYYVLGSQGMSQNNVNSGEELLIPDAKMNDLGVFGLMNYDFKKLQIQGGLRYDLRNIVTQSMQTDEVDFLAFENSYASLNYSLGGFYPIDNYKFRVNYSSGFRAPTTSELLSNGVHEGAIRYEIGNRDLNNEKASQIDLSLEYEGEHLTFIVNPFLNTINDFIYLSPVDSLIDGNAVYVYSQTLAHLFGGEMQVHYHPHKIHWLHLESGFSTVIAKDENGNSLPLIPANKINSKVKMEFPASKIFKSRSVFIQHVFRMAQERTTILETNSAGYHLFNIGFNLEIQSKKEPIEINFGVNNLFNNEYVDHLSRFKSMGIPNSGIGVFAGIKLNFASQIQ